MFKVRWGNLPLKIYDKGLRVLRVEVKTGPSSNGGIYFHTKYQAQNWPKGGFECQVNNTHRDWIKTGSLYGLVNIARAALEGIAFQVADVLDAHAELRVGLDVHLPVAVLEREVVHVDGAEVGLEGQVHVGEGDPEGLGLLAVEVDVQLRRVRPPQRLQAAGQHLAHHLVEVLQCSGLDAVERRYEEITAKLSDASVTSKVDEMTKLLKDPITPVYMAGSGMTAA